MKKNIILQNIVFAFYYSYLRVLCVPKSGVHYTEYDIGIRYRYYACIVNIAYFCLKSGNRCWDLIY